MEAEQHALLCLTTFLLWCFAVSEHRSANAEEEEKKSSLFNPYFFVSGLRFSFQQRC